MELEFINEIPCLKGINLNGEFRSTEFIDKIGDAKVVWLDLIGFMENLDSCEIYTLRLIASKRLIQDTRALESCSLSQLINLHGRGKHESNVYRLNDLREGVIKTILSQIGTLDIKLNEVIKLNRPIGIRFQNSKQHNQGFLSTQYYIEEMVVIDKHKITEVIYK